MHLTNVDHCNKGICVCVVLVAVICDHPTMCKVCGFGDHRHKNLPCTKCEVNHELLFSEDSLANCMSMQLYAPAFDDHCL